MSDHYHHASEIQGTADDRHGHPDLERDISSIERDLRNHRHYDLEREDERLKALLDQWQAHLRELREDLRDALERIRALEDRQPDYAGPDPEQAPANEPRSLPGDLTEAACRPEPARLTGLRLWKLRKLPYAETDEEVPGAEG